MRNLPNYLTIIRILLIPLIIVSFYFDDLVIVHRVAASLFFVAGVTDFFDGYLARKLNIESNFGKMLDPIADKILVGSTLLVLVAFAKVHLIPCILILVREFVVSGLREFLSTLRVSVPVSNLAKIKTAVQMFALFTLLLGNKGSGLSYLDDIGNYALWLAAILTIITGYSYFKATKQYFLENEF